jgi:hypothetical protein
MAPSLGQSKKPRFHSGGVVRLGGQSVGNRCVAHPGDGEAHDEARKRPPRRRLNPMIGCALGGASLVAWARTNADGPSADGEAAALAKIRLLGIEVLGVGVAGGEGALERSCCPASPAGRVGGRGEGG